MASGIGGGHPAAGRRETRILTGCSAVPPEEQGPLRGLRSASPVAGVLPPTPKMAGSVEVRSLRPSRAFDSTTAHSARVYNYWLGGKDNYAADRALGEEVPEAVAIQRRTAQASREFLMRAVRYLVGQADVRQILDLGCGLPSTPNVHEVADETAEGVRVVYLDNDPMVAAHARAELVGTHGSAVAAFLEADVRDPAGMLNDPTLDAVLDLARPVAVLMCELPAFLSECDDPTGIVAEIMGQLAVGSYLALTHATPDFGPWTSARMVAAAARAGVRYTPRPYAQVEALFTGMELVEPGLVSASCWRPNTPHLSQDRAWAYAGVGRVR